MTTPEAAATAAQHGRQVQPAQVAVGEDGPERVAGAPRGDGRGPVRAALADEQQDRDRDEHGRDAEDDRGAAPARERDERHADHRHDDRAEIATRDVGTDRESASLGRELLGQQAVADRVLRRTTDPRDDIRDGEGEEAAGQRLGREPATEQQATRAQEAATRDPSGQLGVGQLDRAGGERTGRGEEGDDLDADPELIDDRQEDERQQDGLGVVDRMGDRQEHERAIRMHIVGRLARS